MVVLIENRQHGLSGWIIHLRSSSNYALCIYITLLMVIVSNVAGEATNKSIASTLFGRWLCCISVSVELVKARSTSSIDDLITVATIDDKDILASLNVVSVNDIHVRLKPRSIFVRGISMKYIFRHTSESKTSEGFISYDNIYPFTLSVGESNYTQTLQSSGLHEITIAIIGWFGIQLGLSQTVHWTVANTFESPSSIISPFPTPAPLASSTHLPTNPPASILTNSPTIVPTNPPTFMPTHLPTIKPTSLRMNQPTINVVGDLQLWHKITIVFNNGPSSSESATPNPFTDFRLDVEFRNGINNTLMTVPGYYAADGNAQHTSATSGRVWHCHFAPTEIGSWSWQASFLTGPNIAMATPGNVVGSSVSPIHGSSGSFIVQPSNKTGVDLRGKGLLRRVKGKHHLQFAGNGEWFLKAGADSPENFLAYDDFDNTPDNGQRRKSWSKHIIDFAPGDPTWADGKGKGIIGAINYLSGQGMRAFSFLIMNINGDDNNVYPYVDPSDRLRFDVSKLAQWEIVFEHGTKMGMFMHFKTQEEENDHLLDQGDLGNERKLYYRELIARFGHHLALNWNIGEENTNTVAQQTQFADWFKLLDPYKHPIVIHTMSKEQKQVYGPLYGHANYDGASLQTDAQTVFADTIAIIQDSVAAGNPWVVANDEQGSSSEGVVPDSVDAGHDSIRRDVLWGNIMAGGAGVEYYFGYKYENSDLSCEDYRSRANMWVQSRYALEFFAKYNIPFHDMVNSNIRVTNSNWCLVERSVGSVIVVYLPRGGTASINLQWLGNGVAGKSMSVHWYDPRNGGALQRGSILQFIRGTAQQALGDAPNNPRNDWVVLLQLIVT